ncbi:hypothetical protein AVEN_19632-1 [Araneus ventricosus]|uniref:Uncharacterized protein n=1 Tax=Araneus ventricosus TaxID=182803 RepID=A0A4Y1ZRQ7_ARAVE|nr:hypothetical protein AVEN_19632-1 [Araneus ventricosus]
MSNFLDLGTEIIIQRFERTKDILRGACGSSEPLTTVDSSLQQEWDKMFMSGDVFRDLGLVGGGGGWGTNQESGSRRGGEAKVDFWSQSGVISKEQMGSCR